MKQIHSLAICSLLALGMAACGGSQPEPESTPPAAEQPPPPSIEPPKTTSTEVKKEEEAPPPPPAPKSITVPFEAKSSSKLTGQATLTEEGTGVKVAIEIAGAKPGDHGAHVHETPDCSAPDAKSAGSHYNPDKKDHGMPDAAAHHIGDLGNIKVEKDGKGTLTLTIADANLKGGDDPHSLLNRSIIIHEKKDDGGQPVGNAGGRIGCGVIKE